MVWGWGVDPAGSRSAAAPALAHGSDADRTGSRSDGRSTGRAVGVRRRCAVSTPVGRALRYGPQGYGAGPQGRAGAGWTVRKGAGGAGRRAVVRVALDGTRWCGWGGVDEAVRMVRRTARPAQRPRPAGRTGPERRRRGSLRHLAPGGTGSAGPCGAHRVRPVVRTGPRPGPLTRRSVRPGCDACGRVRPAGAGVRTDVRGVRDIRARRTGRAYGPGCRPAVTCPAGPVRSAPSGRPVGGAPRLPRGEARTGRTSETGGTGGAERTGPRGRARARACVGGWRRALAGWAERGRVVLGGGAGPVAGRRCRAPSTSGVRSGAGRPVHRWSMPGRTAPRRPTAPRPARTGQSWSDFVWRYSARPCTPSSRPTPDCL